MVSPSHPSASSPKSSYLVLAVKILLVLIILLLLPKLVYGGPHRHRHAGHPLLQFRQYWQFERTKCEQHSDCARLIPEESLNCIYDCMSPTCYQRVYYSTTNPLENGEIDINRATEFETCLHEEFNKMREQQRQERMKKRMASTLSS
jgi:hypothetical protein